jgi:protein TonB
MTLDLPGALGYFRNWRPGPPAVTLNEYSFQELRGIVGLMFKRYLSLSLFLLMVAGVSLLQPLPAYSAGGARVVRTKVQPVYPEAARRAHLEGVVKLELQVAPNGAIRKATVTGGNPLLAEAALDAVRQWRYDPAPAETTEVVELHFNL